MPTLIGRRAVLGALAAPFLAGSAEARPPFRLREDPQPLLSPPILDEAGTTRKLDDFGGRVPSDKPPIKTPGELAIERGEPWPQPQPEPEFKAAIAWSRPSLIR